MGDESIWAPFPASMETEPVLAPPPRRRRPPALLAVVAALVVALGLAGFGAARHLGDTEGPERVTTQTTSGRPPPAAALAAAPAASRAAGNAHIVTTMHAREGGMPLNLRVAGTIGLGTSTYDLTYSVDGGPAGFADASDMGEQRAFSDGTTVWTTLPPYMTDMPQLVQGPKAKNPLRNKKYMAFKADQVGEGLFGPADGTALGFSIGSAPGEVMAYLSGVGSVVEEGTEQIDGQEVTRYGVDLDLDALQRALPSEERSFDAYDFKPDVPHTFPAKVWLDGAGRLRRLTYRLDLSTLLTDVALKADYQVEECPEPDPELARKAAAGDSQAIAALDRVDSECTERPPRPEELVTDGSVDLTDYGTPFSVSAPPANEVVTEDELDAFFMAQAGPPPADFTSTVKPRSSKAPATTTP